MTNLSAAGTPAPTLGDEILSGLVWAAPRRPAGPLRRAARSRIGTLARARFGGDLRRLGLFLAVGLVGLAVDAAVFSAFHAGGASRAIARALSLAVATGVTWRLNRRFTFAATGRRPLAEVARYLAVTLVAQGTSYGTFLMLSRLAPDAPALALLVAGAALATGLSFAGQRLFTFRAAP